MSSDRHLQARQLFDAVIDLLPSEREARLREMAADAEMISYVQRLILRSEDDRAPRVAGNVRKLLTSLVQPELKVGDVLGPWRLTAEIGRGGMGKVFKAQRIDGHFEQQAAIKLLGGMPSAKALDYLARERQILASLVHPNIARLYDGGSTESGQPYLVMELVDGINLDRYVSERNLTLQQRIRLLMEICHAVEFAHQRLIIHCDLKPGNILVTPQGRPVLLDFGIARLLGAGPSEDSSPASAAGPGDTSGQTLTRAFTPMYASPEQKRGDALTTATDVFSLGCLLKSLVMGTAVPLGDVMAVAAMATLDDPARRYPSAAALARELQRLLERRPLDALRHRPLHGVRQHVLRNWPWVATAMFMLGVITTSVVQVLGERDRALAAERLAVTQRDETLVAQARVVAERNAAQMARGEAIRERDRAANAEARAAAERNVARAAALQAVQERDRARIAQMLAQDEQRKAAAAEGLSRQTNEFLVSIFESSNPTAESGDVPASRLLAAAEARLERELAGQPGVQAELYSTMGRAQANMGNTRQAVANYQRALALERELDRPLVLAELLNRMALLRGANFGVAQAEPLARESLALRERHAAPDAEVLAESMTTLGNILTSRGQRAESYKLLTGALAIRKKQDPASAGVASSLHSLALHSLRFEEFDTAFEQFKRSLALRKALVGEGHPDYLVTLEEYGNALNMARRYAEAEAVMRQALDRRKLLHGADNEKVAFGLNVLGSIVNRQGRNPEAISIYRQALEIVAAKFGKRSMPYASVLNNLAIPLSNSGYLDGAEQAYSEAMAIFESIWPEDDLTLARVRYNVGRIRTQLGRLDAAETPLFKALVTRTKVLGAKHGDTLESLVSKSEWELARGQLVEVEAAVRELISLQPFKDVLTEINFERLRARLAIARHEPVAARDAFLRAEALTRRAMGEDSLRSWFALQERAEWQAQSTELTARREAASLARQILDRTASRVESHDPRLVRLRMLLEQTGL